jgi:hypothetical protein
VAPRLWISILLTTVLGQGPSRADGEATSPGPLPLTVDFKRAPVGSWAEYAVTVGGAGGGTMKVRWAFLGRDAGGNTLELVMEGPAAATPRVGGRVVTRMVLVPDPVGASRPFRALVMQIGDREPVAVPLDLPGLPAQKFQNPDPKKRVGRETIKVAAGALDTSHYHDVLPDSVVDSWVSDRVPPLGVVKIVSTPRPEAEGPGGRPLPPVTMELLARGQGAQPLITRAARPLHADGDGKE